jgi:hypothetical protein
LFGHPNASTLHLYRPCYTSGLFRRQHYDYHHAEDWTPPLAHERGRLECRAACCAFLQLSQDRLKCSGPLFESSCTHCSTSNTCLWRILKHIKNFLEVHTTMLCLRASGTHITTRVVPQVPAPLPASGSSDASRTGSMRLICCGHRPKRHSCSEQAILAGDCGVCTLPAHVHLNIRSEPYRRPASMASERLLIPSWWTISSIRASHIHAISARPGRSQRRLHSVQLLQSLKSTPNGLAVGRGDSTFGDIETLKEAFRQAI